MDVDRRHKTPGSDTKDFISHSTAGGMNFMFLLFPPSPQERQARGILGLHHGWISLSLETSVFSVNYEQTWTNLSYIYVRRKH